jgi:hypothetical protein
MSATGRGGERVGEDFYPTPAWCTRRILLALGTDYLKRNDPGPHQNFLDGGSFLEPCAGDGAIVNVIREAWPGATVNGGDVRNLPAPATLNGSWSVGSFDRLIARYDVVITNPPFSLAPEIIAHFLPRCDWLILLLRSSFKLVSEGRKDRPGHNYRDNMPDEYKLPQRPEFVASEKCKGTPGNQPESGCGWSQKFVMSAQPSKRCPSCGGRVQRSTTDASEYSWFVWTPERGRKFGRTCVLPDTPLTERVADRGAK